MLSESEGVIYCYKRTEGMILLGRVMKRTLHTTKDVKYHNALQVWNELEIRLKRHSVEFSEQMGSIVEALKTTLGIPRVQASQLDVGPGIWVFSEYGVVYVTGDVVTAVSTEMTRDIDLSLMARGVRKAPRESILAMLKEETDKFNHDYNDGNSDAAIESYSEDPFDTSSSEHCERVAPSPISGTTPISTQSIELQAVSATASNLQLELTEWQNEAYRTQCEKSASLARDYTKIDAVWSVRAASRASTQSIALNTAHIVPWHERIARALAPSALQPHSSSSPPLLIKGRGHRKQFSRLRSRSRSRDVDGSRIRDRDRSINRSSSRDRSRSRCRSNSKSKSTSRCPVSRWSHDRYHASHTTVFTLSSDDDTPPPPPPLPSTIKWRRSLTASNTVDLTADLHTTTHPATGLVLHTDTITTRDELTFFLDRKLCLDTIYKLAERTTKIPVHVYRGIINDNNNMSRTNGIAVNLSGVELVNERVLTEKLNKQAQQYLFM